MKAKRGALARIGVALLNTAAPGLGLLRLGRWSLALAVYGPTLAVLLFICFGPLVGFPIYALAVLIGLGAILFSIAASWWLGRVRSENAPTWTRWYVIALVGLGAIGINFVLTDENRRHYRNFYTPSEGMAPTLQLGDRFVAFMRLKELVRGDVVLVRTRQGDAYVKRLVGLPGDRIAVQNGVVVLNGTPIGQRVVSTELVNDASEAVQARRLEEQFPGESKPHFIYDLGSSIGDNFGPVRIRAGHYFLMGDNRDRSADSRFGPEEFGIDQVPAGDILGEALFYSWGSSRPIGEAIVAK